MLVSSFMARGLWKRLPRSAFLLFLAPITACTQVLDFDSLTGGEQAATETGCGSHPSATFCDDFDGDPPGNIWVQGLQQSNGAATIDQTRSVSSPSALLTESFGLAANGGQVRAVAATTFPQFENQKIKIHVSFDMVVEAFDPNSGANLMAFQLLYGPLNDFNQLVIGLNSTGSAVTWQMTENAGGVTSGFQLHGPFIEPNLTADWVHFDIEINILEPVGGANTFSIKTNGQTAIETRALGVPLKGSYPRVELGIGWVDTAQTTQRWAVRYDNFVADIQPL